MFPTGRAWGVGAGAPGEENHHSGESVWLCRKTRNKTSEARTPQAFLYAQFTVLITPVKGCQRAGRGRCLMTHRANPTRTSR